jgi:hypothetical protein
MEAWALDNHMGRHFADKYVMDSRMLGVDTAHGMGGYRGNFVVEHSVYSAVAFDLTQSVLAVLWALLNLACRSALILLVESLLLSNTLGC